jgi:hypothetical protein
LSDERGVSLIEALTAIFILGGTLLGLAQLFVVGLAQMAASGPDIIAREKATDALESVFTARDARTITFAQIRNEQGGSGADGGIFRDGEQPLSMPGADGLVNTADDGAVESFTMPGRDGQLGTGDDQVVPLAHFTREVEIRDVGPNLRRVRVIVRYRVGGARRQYALDTLVSAFA